MVVHSGAVTLRKKRENRERSENALGGRFGFGNQEQVPYITKISHEEVSPEEAGAGVSDIIYISPIFLYIFIRRVVEGEFGACIMG
jgi:hypothetical protein